MASHKLCPKCDERLDPDARACACGWSGDKAAKRKGEGPDWNHRCQWRYGTLACVNPVGLFSGGMASGLCIFHRATASGHQAAEIARDSAVHDAESYTEAAKRHTYGTGDNPVVARLRAQIAAHKAGRTVGILSSRLMRESGEDRPD